MTPDQCVTCGDVAVRACVRELGPDRTAIVDVDGAAEEVSVALVDVAVGDVVLVHAKEALVVLS